MVLPLDHHSDSGMDARSAKRLLTQAFREAGLPFAEDDALELVLDATGLDRTSLMLRGTEALSPTVLETIKHGMSRRLAGEPVDHILGWREFYGRRFTISKDVLSPRGDTEALIRAALKALAGIPKPCLLDLGTGSGAIGLTLLAERPDATLLATDISEPALTIARQNAKTLQVEDRVTFARGVWWDAVPDDARFEAILSNPPYIDAAAMATLEPDVAQFDPALALDGGVDGLRDYRLILKQAETRLSPSGWLGLEIGYDQGERVTSLIKAAGFSNVRLYQDLGGHDRVVSGSKST